MWMPSVFGLSHGAVMLTPYTSMLSQLWKATWKNLLFNREILLIVPCETLANRSDCIK